MIFRDLTSLLKEMDASIKLPVHKTLTLPLKMDTVRETVNCLKGVFLKREKTIDIKTLN